MEGVMDQRNRCRLLSECGLPRRRRGDVMAIDHTHYLDIVFYQLVWLGLFIYHGSSRAGSPVGPRLKGVLLNSNFEMVCERPPRSLRSRLPLTRGRLACNVKDPFSPSVRGRAVEGGGGRSHTILRSWATGPKAGAYKCPPSFTSCLRIAFNCSRRLALGFG
jgi:hypothetical protein